MLETHGANLKRPPGHGREIHADGQGRRDAHLPPKRLTRMSLGPQEVASDMRSFFPLLHRRGISMRGKLVLTALIGLVLGAVILFAGWHPQALGQRTEAPQHWEYKIETFLGHNDEETRELNRLA